MAIKHVVTRGYGFADGTDFIPTRGYGDMGGIVAVVQRFLLLLGVGL